MWRLKLLAKLVLTRLPFAYGLWRRLGVFRHGDMHKADYALGVTSYHLDLFGGPDRLRGRTALELGPGDSLSFALVAKALGAERSYLVDVGDFADKDIETYRALAAALAARGMAAPDLSGVGSVEEMLTLLDAQYLTEGLESVRSLPSGSVDFIWSHAVLEHIRAHELADLLAEFRRILRPAGSMSHRIDFRDHLGGSLNNLRFSDRLWESDFMAKSGFYTNRVLYSQMKQAIAEAGFDFDEISVDRWSGPPVPRRSLAPRFRQAGDEDLSTQGVTLVARVA